MAMTIDGFCSKSGKSHFSEKQTGGFLLIKVIKTIHHLADHIFTHLAAVSAERFEITPRRRR
jgi:hypothetical protein